MTDLNLPSAPEAPSALPPVFGNLNEKKKANEKPEEIRCILFLAKYVFSFENWIKKTKNSKFILFTTPSIENQLSFSEKKYFYLIETFENYDSTGLMELRALELSQNSTFPIQHVVFLSEEDILRGNRIRNLLKLKSWDESSLRFRDKVLMKKRLISKDLKCPKFKEIENPSDLLMFKKKHGLPFVLKPRKGFGSVSTFVIKDEESFQKILKTFSKNGILDAPLEYEAEVFCYGDFYHIDGLVFEGKVLVLWPSCYINQVVNFHENNFIAGHSLSKDNPKTKLLQKFIVDCLNILEGPKTYPFHAEAWITPKNELVFCEVASRTGGGGIPGQFEALFGINLNKIYAQSQAEEPNYSQSLKEKLNLDSNSPWENNFPKTTQLLAWIFIYPQEFSKLIRIPTECSLQFVVTFENFVENGKEYRERESCADACCSILVSGENETKVKENVKKAQEWFNDNCEWEKIK